MSSNRSQLHRQLNHQPTPPKNYHVQGNCNLLSLIFTQILSRRCPTSDMWQSDAFHREKFTNGHGYLPRHCISRNTGTRKLAVDEMTGILPRTGCCPTTHITNLILSEHRRTRKKIIPHSLFRRTITLPRSWRKASRLLAVYPRLPRPPDATGVGTSHPGNTNSPQEETRDGQQGWLESLMGRPGQTRPMSVHLLYLSLAVFHSVVVFECMRVRSVMYNYIPCWMRQNRPDRPECEHKWNENRRIENAISFYLHFCPSR